MLYLSQMFSVYVDVYVWSIHYESSGGPFSCEISSENSLEFSSENIRCTHEVCKQTYSWGASVLLP